MQVCNQRHVQKHSLSVQTWAESTSYDVRNPLKLDPILLWMWLYSEMSEWQKMDREMLLLHVLSLFTMLNPLTASRDHLDIHNHLPDNLQFGKKWKSDLCIWHPQRNEPLMFVEAKRISRIFFKIKDSSSHNFSNAMFEKNKTFGTYLKLSHKKQKDQ